MTYGDLLVKLAGEEYDPNYTIRHLTVEEVFPTTFGQNKKWGDEADEETIRVNQE